ARDLAEARLRGRGGLGEVLREIAVHARRGVVEDDVLGVAHVEADEVVIEATLRELRGEEVARRDRRLRWYRAHRGEEGLVAGLASQDRLTRRRAARLAAEERVREIQRERQAAEREREEEAAGEDADRDPPTPAFAQRRDAKDRRAERERDERSAVLVVERVLAAVVGQHQVPE